MKNVFITILTCSIFFMMTLLTAEVKEKKGDDFLRINDNIQNEELRLELTNLREEFNFERNRVKEYYTKKMVVLKETRKNEIKTIKKDFAERREALMKKYFGKMRKKPAMETTEPVKNVLGKKKALKDKKKIRKP